MERYEKAMKLGAEDFKQIIGVKNQHTNQCSTVSIRSKAPKTWEKRKIIP